MSNELKNAYGDNVSWFCLEGSITLEAYRDEKSGTIDDEFEVYGEDESGQEGSVNVGVVELLESAHVVIDEKDDQITQLEKDKAELVEVLVDAQRLINTVGDIQFNLGYSTSQARGKMRKLFKVHGNGIFIRVTELLERMK